MIYDRLENLHLYRGCFKNLDTVIDWLNTHSVDDLPLGKTVIDGEDVFVNVMEAQTRPAEGAQYEVHGRYMDLQLNLQGGERFAVGDGSCEVDPEADAGFCGGTERTQSLLTNGWFVLFPTGEPHMPTLHPAGETTQVKKAVFKISKK